MSHADPSLQPRTSCDLRREAAEQLAHIGNCTTKSMGTSSYLGINKHHSTYGKSYITVLLHIVHLATVTAASALQGCGKLKRFGPAPYPDR